jgi:hypothetical protein
MNSYYEVLDDNGNIISTVRRNSLGIVEVYKIDSGITSYIIKGKIAYKKDKNKKIVYPEPSAPMVTKEKIKSYLKNIIISEKYNKAMANSSSIF